MIPEHYEFEDFVADAYRLQQAFNNLVFTKAEQGECYRDQDNWQAKIAAKEAEVAEKQKEILKEALKRKVFVLKKNFSTDVRYDSYKKTVESIIDTDPTNKELLSEVFGIGLASIEGETQKEEFKELYMLSNLNEIRRLDFRTSTNISPEKLLAWMSFSSHSKFEAEFVEALGTQIVHDMPEETHFCLLTLQMAERSGTLDMNLADHAMLPSKNAVVEEHLLSWMAENDRALLANLYGTYTSHKSKILSYALENNLPHLLDVTLGKEKTFSAEFQGSLRELDAQHNAAISKWANDKGRLDIVGAIAQALVPVDAVKTIQETLQPAKAL